VLRGRGQHFLQQLPIARLQLILLEQGAVSLGDAIGKRVANPLELLEPGNPWLGIAGGNRDVEGKTGKRLRAEAGELVLETANLAAQLSAREALVASHSKRRERVSIEQIRHKPGYQSKSRASVVP
jgi:hypothetical protein